VVRTRIDPRALAPRLREIVRHIDRDTDVKQLGRMADLLDKRFAQERAVAHLSGFFSVLALVLCGIGLYGMLSYNVARRTREVGVRIALGASTSDVLALVLKQGLWLAVAGCVVGVIAAAGLGRLTERLLYGVRANDLGVLATVILLMLVVALIACWLPARRATKVDPMVALRTE
jgi:ABC-type antimicrobial peptide transport system permease subunit